MQSTRIDPDAAGARRRDYIIQRCYLPAAAMFGDTQVLHQAAVAVAADEVNGDALIAQILHGIPEDGIDVDQGLGEGQGFGGALEMAAGALAAAAGADTNF